MVEARDGEQQGKPSHDTLANQEQEEDLSVVNATTEPREQHRTILCGIATRLAKGIKRRFDELEALDHRVVPDKNEQAIIL